MQDSFYLITEHSEYGLLYDFYLVDGAQIRLIISPAKKSVS